MPVENENAPRIQKILTQEDDSRKKLREALARARERSAKRGDHYESELRTRLGNQSRLDSLLQGLQSTASQGFSDDFERMNSGGQSLSDRLARANPEQKVAINHLVARSEHPITHGVGQLIGAFGSGFGTRYVPQTGGAVMRGAASRRYNPDIENYATAVRDGQEALARGDTRAVAATRLPRSQRNLAESTAARGNALALADRVAAGGMNTNRQQAIVYDALHGGAMGYGGLDPTKNEDAFSLARLGRAGAGAATGAALAPSFAATGTFGTQASKFAGQQMGLNPSTPLRQRRLIGTPREAIEHATHADELAARNRAGPGVMPPRRASSPPDERGDVTLYPGSVNQGGPSVQAMTNAAETPSRRVRAVERSVSRGTPDETLARAQDMARRGADPEGIEQIAGAMERRGRDEVGQDAVARMQRMAFGRGRPDDPAIQAAMQNDMVQTLLGSFDRRDLAARQSWVNAVRPGAGGAFAATRGARGALQVAMGQRLASVYQREGVDGLVRTLRDPDLAPYWNAVGFGTLADEIEQQAADNAWTLAAQQLRQTMPTRAERAARPRMAARADRRTESFEIAPDDARRLRTEAASNPRLPRDPARPELQRSPQIFEATRASFADYMREAARSTMRRFGADEDFSVADVTAGGGLATVFAAAIEQYGIGPAVDYLMSQGMPENEAVEAAQAAAQPVRGVPVDIARRPGPPPPGIGLPQYLEPQPPRLPPPPSLKPNRNALTGR